MISTDHLQQILKQDLSQLNQRTSETVMSVLTKLPVPTTFDNGVQSIINICVTEMEPTNRQTGTDKGDI